MQKIKIILLYALEIESVTFERLKKRLASRKLVYIYYLVPSVDRAIALFKQTNLFSTTKRTILIVRKFS